ncbi:MAG: GNAT family N-acetyltransferase [Oceanicaulis sp.]|nr:GNAT family N-acetyltransferase [Oceanicaulis sp.]MBI74981.1 GNAT family N-acetyltransferase [Oceanicaulis sp.]
MPQRPDITFTRLTEIAPDAILAHMSDPRLAEHMPLLKDGWDMDACTAFIAAKDACWARDGLGHWAILADGRYAGWGGFQKEGEEWDYGLVLRPQDFGLGLAITRKALAFARADARIPYVTLLLPPSRRHMRGLERLGAEMTGEVTYEGEVFRKYRLETP